MLKNTMTTESFTKLCDQFLATAAVQPIAKFVAENPQEISGKNISDLCTIFHKQLSLSTPLPSQIPCIAVASALAPSMIQLNSQYPSIGSPTSPAPKTSRTSKKSTSVPIDGKTYMLRSRNGERICGYRSPRQPNKDLICGAPATTTLKGLPSNDFRDLRCASCKNNIGSIMRMNDDGTSVSTTRTGGKSKTATAASSTPQIPGINIPVIPTTPPVIIGGSNTASPASPAAPVSEKKMLDIIDLTGNGTGYALIDDDGGEFSKMVVNTTAPYFCIGKTPKDLDLKNIPSGFQTKLDPLTSAESSKLKLVYGLEYKPIN